MIVFADDPDVRVVEAPSAGAHPKLSIEIKGGVDASNVYNRLGEAEKSHLKARRAGSQEFWTLVRAHYDPAKATVASPTTTHFFRINRILDISDPEHAEFRQLLSIAIGIR